MSIYAQLGPVGSMLSQFVKSDRAGQEQIFNQLKSLTGVASGLTSVKTQLGAEGRAEALQPSALRKAEAGAESAEVELGERKAGLGREEDLRDLVKSEFGFTLDEFRGLSESEKLKFQLAVAKAKEKLGAVPLTAEADISGLRAEEVKSRADIGEAAQRLRTAPIAGKAVRAEAGLRAREAAKETRLLPAREEGELSTIQKQRTLDELAGQIANEKIEQGYPEESVAELTAISKERLNMKIMQAEILKLSKAGRVSGAPMTSEEADKFIADFGLDPGIKPLLGLENLKLMDDLRAYTSNFQDAVFAIVGLANEKIVPSDMFGEFFPQMSGAGVKQGMDVSEATQLLTAYASSQLASMKTLSPTMWENVLNSFGRQALETFQKMGGTVGEPLDREGRQGLIDEGRRRREQPIDKEPSRTQEALKELEEALRRQEQGGTTE